MPNLISLASGYGSFPPPAVATEAAVHSIRTGLPALPEVAGLPALREAVAHRYQHPQSPSIGPGHVVITPGTKAALFALLTTVLRPADEVLLLTPNWFGFGELVQRAGGTLRELPLSPADNYTLRPEQLRAALTPRTRVLLFSNPNNPTGRVYHRTELAAWLEVTQSFPDLLVLSDEIYDLVNFSSDTIPSLLDFPDPHGQHLVVNGYSKSLGLIGWGIGYLVAPPALAQACTAYLHATGGAVPLPTQQAALAVTQAAPQVARELVNQLRATRHLLLEHLARLPAVPAVTPEATYYAFPDLRAYLPPAPTPQQASHALVQRLRRAGVDVVDGSLCGAPGFVRLSYAVPEPSLREALARLNQGLGKPASVA